jgi:3D-(3,5/4)-trihydroxycyclohexane-1,2-dione acylhydrolase (decyclizing)
VGVAQVSTGGGTAQAYERQKAALAKARQY